MIHSVSFHRRSLSGSRNQGTDARCSCGWGAFTNSAPLSRSRSWQRATEAAHLAQATPEWTLAWLREQLADRTATMTRAAAADAPLALDSALRRVNHAAGRLSAELREQRDAEHEQTRTGGVTAYVEAVRARTSA